MTYTSDPVFGIAAAIQRPFSENEDEVVRPLDGLHDVVLEGATLESVEVKKYVVRSELEVGLDKTGEMRPVGAAIGDEKIETVFLRLSQDA